MRVLMILLLTCTACTNTLPPAVPEEQTIFAPPIAPAPEPPPAIAPEEVQVFVMPRKAGRQERPEKLIEAANGKSRITPTREGYGHGSMQRYPYLPGRLYAIYSSPNHPTTILLPPGERLAAPPTLNPEAWDIGVAEMGLDGMRQEAVIVRPLEAGQEATTPLLTHSGRVFFCRLRSFEHTSMVAVTWEMPSVKLVSLDPPERRPPGLDVSRLHTAYRIETVQGNPPWVPMSVYDDGNKTVMRFRQGLGYTNAPAVFVRHADGTPGLVDFTPYEVPDQPDKGAYYVLQGLWTQLELKGQDGMTVRITRTTGQPAAYKEVMDAR